MHPNRRFRQLQLVMLALCALSATHCGKDTRRATHGAADAAVSGDSGASTRDDAGHVGDAGDAGHAAMDASEPAHDAGDAGTDAAISDAGIDAAMDAAVFGPFTCNPLTNDACSSTTRCAWVEPPGGTGTLSCIADGNLAEGAACTRDGNGVDACERGTVCVSQCSATCDFDDPAATCASTDYCVEYAGIYQSGTDPALAGACKLGCDPVTQLTNTNTACPTNQGCFMNAEMNRPKHVNATCAGYSNSVSTHTQGFALTPPIFINSCAPGFVGLKDKDGNPICTALCTPVESWSGFKSFLGGAAPNDCAARGAGGTHECRYAWIFFSDAITVHPLLQEVGVCVDPVGRMYDSDGDLVEDTAWPSCGDLANTDTDFDGVDDHEAWGCSPFSQ